MTGLKASKLEERTTNKAAILRQPKAAILLTMALTAIFWLAASQASTSQTTKPLSLCSSRGA